jgi:hypothetical protein
VRTILEPGAKVLYVIIARGGAKTQVETHLTSITGCPRRGAIGVWVVHDAQAARLSELLRSLSL